MRSRAVDPAGPHIRVGPGAPLRSADHGDEVRGARLHDHPPGSAGAERPGPLT